MIGFYLSTKIYVNYLKNINVLIAGVAGCIGFNLAKSLK